MIKSVEFVKRMLGDDDVSTQLARFCNLWNITKDKIIDIKYSKANNGTCRASAMLVYEEPDDKKE